MILFSCTNCRHALECEPELGEEYFTCPKCGHRERVPDRTEPAFRDTFDLKANTLSMRIMVLVVAITLILLFILLYYGFGPK